MKIVPLKVREEEVRTESENDEEGKEERKTRQEHNNKSKEIGCSANIHNSKFINSI